MVFLFGIVTCPEDVAFSFVCAGFSNIVVLFKRNLATAPLRTHLDILVGNKQVVVVAVARRLQPAIRFDAHAAAFIAHEGVVEHVVILRGMDQQAKPVKCWPIVSGACEDVVTDGCPITAPLDEQIYAGIAVEPVAFDDIVEVVHVEPQSGAVIFRKVIAAKGAVCGIQPLAAARLPVRQISFPVVVFTR